MVPTSSPRQRYGDNTTIRDAPRQNWANVIPPEFTNVDLENREDFQKESSSFQPKPWGGIWLDSGDEQLPSHRDFFISHEKPIPSKYMVYSPAFSFFLMVNVGPNLGKYTQFYRNYNTPLQGSCHEPINTMACQPRLLNVAQLCSFLFARMQISLQKSLFPRAKIAS